MTLPGIANSCSCSSHPCRMHATGLKKKKKQKTRRKIADSAALETVYL